MFSKAKFVAAFAALAIGVTAFASASQAATYYYWGWGGQRRPDSWDDGIRRDVTNSSVASKRKGG